MARDLVQGGHHPRDRARVLRDRLAHHAADAIVDLSAMSIFNYRIRALIRKELGQIRRDRRLAFSLILPPTLQLLLLGFALSANVENVKLGAIDYSRTPESRELIARLSESRSFRLVSYYDSVNELGDAISRNEVDAGM